MEAKIVVPSLPGGKGVTMFAIIYVNPEGWATVEINDIAVAPGAEEVVFDVQPGSIGAGNIAEITQVKVDLRKSSECFEGVKRIIIGETVRSISITNWTLPNVEEVVSRSPQFKSGSCLVKIERASVLMCNTFCKKPVEQIDLAGVTSINPGAFAGCESANIVNDGLCRTVGYAHGAFDGYTPKGAAGNIIIGDVLIKADAETESLDIPPRAHDACEDAFEGIRATKIRASSVDSIDVLAHAKNLSGKTIVMDFRDGEKWASNFWKIKQENLLDVSIEIPDTDMNYKMVGRCIYSKDGATLYRCIPSSSAQPIRVANGTVRIAMDAFSGMKLSAIEFPTSLRIIEAHAFPDTGLKKVFLPKNVAYVSDFNFQDASEVEQEAKRPIEGVLAIYARHDLTEDVFRLKVGGRTIILPPDPNPKKIKDISSAWDEGRIDPILFLNPYDLSENMYYSEDARLEALCESQNPRNEPLFGEIKTSFRCSMMERYIKNNDIQHIQKMASVGLLAGDFARKLVDKYGDEISTEAKAYLIEAANQEDGRRKHNLSL